jgi:spore germination protein GerM
MKRPAALVVLAVLTAGCAGSSDTSTSVSSSPEPSTTAQTPSEAATPVTSPTAAGTASRAIYYLHDTGNGPRLYREFHPRPATTAVIRDAVTAMLTEKAYDADYTSLWPRGTTVRGARVDSTTAYVDLSAEARSGSAGSEAEAASLQQLVHTVTAAAPAVRSVQLLVGGRVVETLWGHVDTRGPMTRRPAAEILGPVWLLVPRTIKQGARFGGEASVFEATVSWEFRQGGRVVKAGFTNAATGAPGRGPWSDVANVPPGEYVLRAFESSAKDGTPTFVDDKPVTVS